MKLETLVEFRELAHCLNLTEAARNLYIGQPSLSKHMVELEKELGFDLFVKGRKFYLTLAGKAYLNVVCNILFEHEKALVECKKIASSGDREIRLLEPFSNNEASELLQKAARKFVNGGHRAGVAFIGGKTRTAVEAILQGAVDIALTIAGGDNTDMAEQAGKGGLVFEPILTVPLLVWMHQNHHLAHKESVTLNDLSTSTTIMSIANRANDPFRLVTRGMFDSKPLWTIIGVNSPREFYLHANEQDVCIVTPSLSKDYYLAIHEDMLMRPIADPEAKVTFYLVYDEKAGGEGKSEMVRIICETAAEMQMLYPDFSAD